MAELLVTRWLEAAGRLGRGLRPRSGLGFYILEVSHWTVSEEHHMWEQRGPTMTLLVGPAEKWSFRLGWDAG